VTKVWDARSVRAERPTVLVRVGVGIAAKDVPCSLLGQAQDYAMVYTCATPPVLRGEWPWRIIADALNRGHVLGS
jgi:hypothetical protein